jgi:hypothetical protein
MRCFATLAQFGVMNGIKLMDLSTNDQKGCRIGYTT